MSGPSATEKPMSAKIAVISSMTWLIGWMRPRVSGPSWTGSVTSMRSAARRALEGRIGERVAAGRDRALRPGRAGR